MWLLSGKGCDPLQVPMFVSTHDDHDECVCVVCDHANRETLGKLHRSMSTRIRTHTHTHTHTHTRTHTDTQETHMHTYTHSTKKIIRVNVIESEHFVQPFNRLFGPVPHIPEVDCVTARRQDSARHVRKKGVCTKCNKAAGGEEA